MKLEDLQSEPRVFGVEPAGVAKILAMEVGVGSADTACQIPSWTSRMQMLFREHGAKIAAVYQDMLPRWLYARGGHG